MQIKDACLAAAVVVSLLAGCGGGGAPSGGGGGNGATSGGSSAQGGGSCLDTEELIKEDLYFTGGITAHATSDCNEKIGDSDNCTRRSQSFGAVLEKLRLGDRVADFGINLIAYHGPGTYTLPAGSTTQYFIALNIADGGPMWAALKSVVNTVVVNPDERSGTVDAELEPNGNGAGANVHVKGAWRCLP
jgi:hypothetical protein